MGICKCRKRTDLFCFVHKKAVCESCISTEHKTCVIKTYVEWLTDSEYEPATCGICKGDLSDDNSLRLTCLDLFHPECLDVYASSLPAHTAKAGYLCPVCSKPLFPSDDSNPLAQHVNNHLSDAAWSRSLLIVKPDNSLKSQQPTELSDSTETKNTSTEPDLSQTTNISSSLQSPSTKRNVPQEVASTSDSFGIASRKPQRDHAITINDEDDDKYSKKGLSQLLTALGFISAGKQSKLKATRIRLDTRRLLIIVVLVACLVGVIVLGMSMTTSDIDAEDTSIS